MKTYTAKEIAEILQKNGDDTATLRMVRYYTQIGLVPELETIGNKRVYTDNHLRYFQAIRTLSKTGKSLNVIQTELRNMDVSKVNKIANQIGYFSANTLYENTEKEIVELNEDVSITFSHRINKDVQNKIIESVNQILKNNKGES
jgi:DNA-binding transcriptional MerR regulator